MAEVDEGGKPEGGAGGNAFTRKLGPAPLWVWMLAGLGAALAFSSYRKNKAAAGANAAAQTPPIIVQNYPGMGAPGAPGPAGPPGPAGAPGPGAPPPIQGGNPPTVGPPTAVPPAGPPAGPPVQVAPPPRTAQPIEYRVKPGDTLSGIAARYGTSWQKIWTYNTTPAGGRPPETIKELLRRGPNLLYSNELILIPTS